MVKKIKSASDKAASPAAGLLDSQMAQTVKDSAQQIWLAGMGAFSKAQAEGGKVFETLVKEGMNLQRKTQGRPELGQARSHLRAAHGQGAGQARRAHRQGRGSADPARGRTGRRGGQARQGGTRGAWHRHPQGQRQGPREVRREGPCQAAGAQVGQVQLSRTVSERESGGTLVPAGPCASR
jgi:Poly(hydroxyalcanoate) granule associated protein (phasin)